MSASRLVATAALVTAAAVSLSGCALLAPPAATVSGAPATQSSPRPHLTVRLGTLLPVSGVDAAAGASTRAAVQLAVDDVNAADLGVTFEVVDADSGTPGDGQAVVGAQELIDAGVDAVIGPRSSTQALEVYGMFADAGIVEVSPASTLPALGTVPDSGYFFRTVASDELQSRILANRILFDGATTIGIVRQGDAVDVALQAGLAETLAAAGAALVADLVVEPGLEAEAVRALLAQAPEAIVVISRPDGFEPIAEALAAEGVDWSRVYGTDASLEAYRDRLDVTAIEGAVFSSPGVLADRDLIAALHSVDPTVRHYNYAPEAYDAVVLVALAALQARSSEGSAIRDQLIRVSRGPGAVVERYEEGARRILAGEEIDYDGLSGPVDFLPNGDIGEGFVSFYRYDTGNELVWIDQSLGGIDVR